MRREAEPYTLPETSEQPVRVEQPEPQVQGAAANPPRSTPLRRRLVPFEETILLQAPDEGGQRRARECRAEPSFCLLPDDVERCLAVELLGDELLEFPEAKELAGERVLDDAQRCAGRLLVADGQISPQSWWRRNQRRSSPVCRRQGKAAFPIPRPSPALQTLRATALAALALGALAARRAAAVAAPGGAPAPPGTAALARDGDVQRRQTDAETRRHALLQSLQPRIQVHHGSVHLPPHGCAGRPCPARKAPARRGNVRAPCRCASRRALTTTLPCDAARWP